MISAAFGLQVGVPILVLVAVIDDHVSNFLVDLMHVNEFVVHREEKYKGFGLFVLRNEIPFQVLLKIRKLLDLLFYLSIHLILYQINIILLLVLVRRLVLGTRLFLLQLLGVVGLGADG